MAEDGVAQLAWYDYSDSARSFMYEARQSGWVGDFDWMRWAAEPKAQRLLHDPALVASASLTDLSSLLTTLIRGERFSEGEVAGAFESGMLTAIVRRASVLGASQGAIGEGTKP